MTPHRAIVVLVAICIALGAWTSSYLAQELEVPLKGTFWEALPAGNVERANSFLPYLVLWPAPVTLLVLSSLAALVVNLSIRARDVGNPTLRGTVVLVNALSAFLAMGVIVGDGTKHYLSRLDDHRALDATLSEVMHIPCIARSKGDYPTRTVLVFDPPTPWGSHLWVSAGVAWETRDPAIAPGTVVTLRGARDPSGLGVLLSLPEPVRQ